MEFPNLKKYVTYEDHEPWPFRRKSSSVRNFLIFFMRNLVSTLYNFRSKRYMKRSQAPANYRCNNSVQEMFAAAEANPSEHSHLKTIKSHVYYSKKQTQHKSNEKKTESDQMEIQSYNSKCRIQSKIKSSSWKRSDRRGSYIKPWRKKPANWITLQPTKQRSELYTPGRITSSQCRPGTLYSDVVFGGKTSSPPPNDKIPLIEFQKEELNIAAPLLSVNHTNSKIRKKIIKKSVTRSKSISLERAVKDAEIDEAFPPLTSRNHTPSKNDGKNKGTLKMKQRKSMKHSLKFDHLIVNLNTANKANIFFFGNEAKIDNSKNDENEILDSKFGVEKISFPKDGSVREIQQELSNNETESSVNSTLNLSGSSEASINQIAYGLYLKSQFRSCPENFIQFLETASADVKSSNAENRWKYKYLPIMNVKLFEDSDDEYGFGYLGYSPPKRRFLNYERGEQIFPRFSRHFDDEAYLILERKAIICLESTLNSLHS